MNPTTKTYKTSVSLDVTVRAEVVGILNQSLADSLDLYSQVKQAHWNVKGMDFIALHKLFDEIAAIVEASVDTLAERVRALGADAQGTVRMSAAHSSLPEFPSDLSTGEDFVKAVAERVAACANSSRAGASKTMELGDEATGDVYIEITRDLDKMLYFLEAHLQ